MWERSADSDLHGTPIRYRTRAENPHTLRRSSSAARAAWMPMRTCAKNQLATRVSKGTAKRFSSYSYSPRRTKRVAPSHFSESLYRDREIEANASRGLAYPANAKLARCASSRPTFRTSHYHLRASVGDLRLTAGQPACASESVRC